MPELDDQISQNEATLDQLKSVLEQAQANLRLAQVTWERDRPLVHEGWATQQQGTVDVETQNAQQAAVAVAQANLKAQQAQTCSECCVNSANLPLTVVAPFDGQSSRQPQCPISAAWCRA